MKNGIGMRSCALLNFIYLNLLVDFYKSWINWISNFNMIWLISQFLVQPLISLFQFYHVTFNPRMDLCLVVQARIWENSCMESSVELWKQYKTSYYSCIGNWWAQWTTTMHYFGCILCAKKCSCFEWSLPRPSNIQCNQFFSPRNYPRDDSDRNTNTVLGLKKDIIEVSIH